MVDDFYVVAGGGHELYRLAHMVPATLGRYMENTAHRADGGFIPAHVRRHEGHDEQPVAPDSYCRIRNRHIECVYHALSGHHFSGSRLRTIGAFYSAYLIISELVDSWRHLSGDVRTVSLW